MSDQEPEHKEDKAKALTATGDEAETTDLATTEKKPPIKFGDGGLVLETMDDIWRFAGIVAASESCPRSKKQGLMKKEDIFVSVVNGRELGLSPMTAIQNTAVINGRPSVFGEIPLALCRASGLMDDFVETTEVDSSGKCVSATCSTIRKGTKHVVTRTFTEEDAKRAGLLDKNPPLYKMYPQRMLPARARTYALRDAYPDVLKGVITHEEAECMEPIEISATVVEPPTPPSSSLNDVKNKLDEKLSKVQQEPEAPPAPTEETVEETDKPEIPTREKLFAMTKPQLRVVVKDHDLDVDQSLDMSSLKKAIGQALQAKDAPSE